MVLTSQQEACQIYYGKPLKKVVIDLYIEFRDLETVAKYLGITRTGLYNWRQTHGPTDVELHVAVLAHDHPRPTPAGTDNETVTGQPHRNVT